MSRVVIVLCPPGINQHYWNSSIGIHFYHFHVVEIMVMDGINGARHKVVIVRAVGKALSL